jgi:aspartyl aminopeptidase
MFTSVFKFCTVSAVLAVSIPSYSADKNISFVDKHLKSVKLRLKCKPLKAITKYLN